MRTIVEIPGDQIKGLSQLCQREGLSRAEAIRQAVAKMLEEKNPARDGMAGAFGLWKPRAGKVRNLLKQLRSEWP